MLSRILSTGLLVSSLSMADIGRDQTSPAIPLQSNVLYLPLVAQAQRLELVITSFDNTYSCIYSYCEVEGYVRNLSDSSLYSIAVELPITWHPYSIGTPVPPYTSIEQIATALTATLPGQMNPFSYNILLGKTGATFGSIRIGSSLSSLPDGQVYLPLTVAQGKQVANVISGTVGNDTDRILQRVQVVAMSLDGCSWMSAKVITTTLQPASETTFSVDTRFCRSTNIIVLGQGSTPP